MSADSEGPDDYESTVSTASEDSDLDYFDEVNKSINQDPSESEGTPESELLLQTESVLSSELHHASKTPLYNNSHITKFWLIFQFAVTKHGYLPTPGAHLIKFHAPASSS